jgi:cbb3-type cytochrome oxidase maturation protein
MFVVALLIVISLSLATTFLVSFIWAVRAGQFEDTLTPSLRMLTDEDSRGAKSAETPQQTKT